MRTLKGLDLTQLDIPAMPASLVRLSQLLQDQDVSLKALAELVEPDMALSAAVMKAVGSAVTGVRGRISSVQQALTFLGIREVAAITYETSLRAAFPPIVELELLWTRAARRASLMKQLGQEIGLEPYAAHASGLFEECGKAVLFRHAPEHYRGMMRAAPEDLDLVVLERAGFGLGHDELGARLCETWQLAPEAASSVRHHLEVRRSGLLPELSTPRDICAVSAMVWTMMEQPEHLAVMVERLAPQIDRDTTVVLAAAQSVLAQAGA
jgi:HD-like signal output (HDOD) protein